MTSDYLRNQAKTCLTWARECFDLGTATRLRLMAEEFLAKAEEIDTCARVEAARDQPSATHGPPALETGGDAS
jgi:hypothetical protein